MSKLKKTSRKTKTAKVVKPAARVPRMPKGSLVPTLTPRWLSQNNACHEARRWLRANCPGGVVTRAVIKKAWKYGDPEDPDPEDPVGQWWICWLIDVIARTYAYTRPGAAGFTLEYVYEKLGL